MPELEKQKGKGGMVLVLPLAHSFGNIGMTVALIDGYKNILFPRPPDEITDLLKVIKKEKATYMPGVPTLYNKIAQEQVKMAMERFNNID